MLRQFAHLVFVLTALVGPVAFARIGAFAAEDAKAHAGHGHHPDAANHVLLLVHILGVDALSVVDTYLIVQQVALPSIGQEVALHLHADVTSVAGLDTTAVREIAQLVDGLGIAEESLVDRMHWILKGKSTLELTDLHFEETIFLPLGERVDDTRRVAERGRVAVELQLHLPIPVLLYTAFEGDTAQTDVKRVGLGVFLVAILILCHHIARELHVVDPLWQLGFGLSQSGKA